MIIGDILVLVVTWMKTAQSYSEARRLKMKAPLSRMLIRDGTVVQLRLSLPSVYYLVTDHDVPTGTLYFVYAVSVYSFIPSVI